MSNNVASIVEVGLVVVAAAAGVVGYFRARLSSSTIELYKEDNEALRARLSTLEAQSAVDEAEIRALKAAHATLVGIVTQADQITAVRAQLDRIEQKIGSIT